MIGRFSFAPFCLVVSIAWATFSLDASAQNSPLGKIAIVDIQRILDESLAANSIREQIKAMSLELGKEARRVSKELQDQEKDLAAKRSILAPERVRQLLKELRERAKNEQVSLNRRRQASDRSLKIAMAKVQGAFEKVATEIAKERSYAIVLRKGSVVLAPAASDITSEVLKRLDKDLPKVKVEPAPPEKPKAN